MIREEEADRIANDERRRLGRQSLVYCVAGDLLFFETGEVLDWTEGVGWTRGGDRVPA